MYPISSFEENNFNEFSINTEVKYFKIFYHAEVKFLRIYLISRNHFCSHKLAAVHQSTTASISIFLISSCVRVGAVLTIIIMS